MKEKIIKIVGIVFLIGFIAQIWAWMLGVFALPPEALEAAPANFAKWMNPGIMAVPAFVSILVAFLVLYLVSTLFKNSEK